MNPRLQLCLAPSFWCFLVDLSYVLQALCEFQESRRRRISFISLLQICSSRSSLPIGTASLTMMRSRSALSWLFVCVLSHAIHVFGFSVNNGSPAADVICVGEALFDCIATERGISIDEMAERHAFEAFAGGATANVASACCKLGTSSAWIGCLGADEDGDQIIEILSSAGVNVDLVQQTTQQPTRRVMVTRNKDTGDREFGGFWENRAANEFADCLLDDTELFPGVETLLHDAQWIVCGTLGLAYPASAAAMRRLVESTKQTANPPKLLVDVNWRPVFWKDSPYSESEARQTILDFVQDAEVLKMTDEEVEWLLGIPADESIQNPELVHKNFPNAKAVLVTAGENGASYSMACCSGFIPALPIDIVETTGAGDAFTAGFLNQVITQCVDLGNLQDTKPNDIDRGDFCMQIVKFASAVGGLTCTGNGAIPAQPLLKDVETLLATT